MTSWETLAQRMNYQGEREMWQALYHTHKLAIHDLAQKFACSPFTVRSRLLACGIQMRSRGGPRNVKVEVDDNLLQEIKTMGVRATARKHGVKPQTLYTKLYYNKGTSIGKLKQEAYEAQLKEQQPTEEEPKEVE